jgi:hypothetical protein
MEYKQMPLRWAVYQVDNHAQEIARFLSEKDAIDYCDNINKQDWGCTYKVVHIPA